MPDMSIESTYLSEDSERRNVIRCLTDYRARLLRLETEADKSEYPQPPFFGALKRFDIQRGTRLWIEAKDAFKDLLLQDRKAVGTAAWIMSRERTWEWEALGQMKRIMLRWRRKNPLKPNLERRASLMSAIKDVLKDTGMRYEDPEEL